MRSLLVSSGVCCGANLFLVLGLCCGETSLLLGVSLCRYNASFFLCLDLGFSATSLFFGSRLRHGTSLFVSSCFCCGKSFFHRSSLFFCTRLVRSASFRFHLDESHFRPTQTFLRRRFQNLRLLQSGIVISFVSLLRRRLRIELYACSGFLPVLFLHPLIGLTHELLKLLQFSRCSLFHLCGCVFSLLSLLLQHERFMLFALGFLNAFRR
jgi:hypothetical protein